MLLRTACALLALASSSLSAADELTWPSPFRISFGVVHKLTCDDGARGSGVRISDDIVITARHVVQDGETGNWRKCSTKGVTGEVVALGDKGLDFAALRMPIGRGLRGIVSCEGVKEGERYYAYGYAFGEDANVEPLIGTSKVASDGRVYLRGRVFPGDSGGALANSEGAIVAIIVQYNSQIDHSIVVPLTKTYLCRRS